MNRLVSIIVPVYNRVSLILETLESVGVQTYSPIELLVVDDGSTDGTKTVVDEWAGKSGHEHCLLLSLPENVGKSAAVNYALDRFRGDYVMVVDSDDILLPDAIVKEVNFLQAHPDVGIVSARPYKLVGNMKTSVTFDVFKESDTCDDVVGKIGDLLLNGNTIISSTVMMRREVVKHIGYLNVNLRYTHDWEYWVRVARHFKIGYLAQPVIYYRTHVAGASSMNRLGTFHEISVLLLAARSDYRKRTLLSSIVRQTKDNASLAYHDPRYTQMVRIMISGLVCFLRVLLHVRKR